MSCGVLANSVSACFGLDFAVSSQLLSFALGYHYIETQHLPSAYDSNQKTPREKGIRFPKSFAKLHALFLQGCTDDGYLRKLDLTIKAFQLSYKMGFDILQFSTLL